MRSCYRLFNYEFVHNILCINLCIIYHAQVTSIKLYFPHVFSLKINIIMRARFELVALSTRNDAECCSCSDLHGPTFPLPLNYSEIQPASMQLHRTENHTYIL